MASSCMMFELFCEFRHLFQKLIRGTGQSDDTSLYFLIKYGTFCENGVHNLSRARFPRFQHCITSMRMSYSLSKETLGIVCFLKVGWKWMVWVLFLFCFEIIPPVCGSVVPPDDHSHRACSEILPATFLKLIRPQITRQITDFMNSAHLFDK